MLTQNHGLSTLFSRNHAWRGRIARLTAVLFAVGSLLSQAHAGDTVPLAPDSQKVVAPHALRNSTAPRSAQTDDFYISNLSVSYDSGFVIITGTIVAEEHVNMSELMIYTDGSVVGFAPPASDGSFTIWAIHASGTSYAQAYDQNSNYSAPIVFYTN
jgi:hypothetical protein